MNEIRSFDWAVGVIIALIGVVWTLLQGQIKDVKGSLSKKADRAALDALESRADSDLSAIRGDLQAIQQRMERRFDQLTEQVIRAIHRAD